MSTRKRRNGGAQVSTERRARREDEDVVTTKARRTVRTERKRNRSNKDGTGLSRYAAMQQGDEIKTTRGQTHRGPRIQRPEEDSTKKAKAGGRKGEAQTNDKENSNRT